jgi:hypothetical protein
VTGGLSSVTYGNGKFVAVSYKSTNVAYSEDGINWIQTTLPSKSNWYAIAYGNGKFVAVSYGDVDETGNGIIDTNKVAYSEDGINWELSSMPVSSGWVSIAYGNGKFVSLTDSSDGSYVAAYSEDGINWTQTTLPVGGGWFSVTYGNGKFIAGNEFTGIIYSNDGINWIEATLPLSANWGPVAYGEQTVLTSTPLDVTLSLKISRTGNAYNAITIDLIYNSGVEATYIYSCVYNKETDTADDTLSKFVITTHPKGFVSKEEVSSDAAMKLLYELGIIDPIANSNGEILTDENGNIFVF